MKSFLKSLRHLLRFVFRLSLFFAAFAILALLVRDVELPAAWTDAACRRLSGEDFVVRVDRAAFNLDRGLTIANARLLERERPSVTPVVKAESIEVKLALLRFPWRRARIVESVRVKGLAYRRLPESYYMPNSVLHPGEPDYRERDRPFEPQLPLVKSFRAELIDSDILGIRPARLVIGSCSISPRGVFAKDISIDWPDDDTAMRLDGSAEMDLVAQKVRGEVHGFARQRHIRPLLEALDVPSAYPYIDGFTGVTAPVRASAEVEVDLRKSDFGLKLDLAPEGGFYNSVPFTRAHGRLDISNRVRGTDFEFRVIAGPIEAEFPDGGRAKAVIDVSGKGDELAVSVNAESKDAKVKELLALADILNDGTLDCLESDRADVAIEGTLHPREPKKNDLRGRIAFRSGSLFGVGLADASCDFIEEGESVRFTNAFARAAGGEATGTARIVCPDFKDDLAHFTLTLDARDMALRSLAETFSIASEDRDGIVDGHISLSGPLSTNLASRLTGAGSFTTRNGHLSRINLFMGFTDWMSRNVPGVSSIIDQSSASADFTIDAGVIETKNLAIEGNVFSVRGEGAYSIPDDRLDAKIHARLCRSDSIVGRIVQPITSPLLKTLLEFRVTGPVSEPKWSYSSPLERITGGGKDATK